METDNRRHPRIKANLEVHFHDREELRNAVSDDISQGGMYVSADHPLDIGDLVTLQLDLPDTNDKLRIEGSVAHHKPYPNGKPVGFGVEFIVLSSEGKTLLRRFLAKLGG